MNIEHELLEKVGKAVGKDMRRATTLFVETRNESYNTKILTLMDIAQNVVFEGFREYVAKRQSELEKKLSETSDENEKKVFLTQYIIFNKYTSLVNKTIAIALGMEEPKKKKRKK